MNDFLSGLKKADLFVYGPKKSSVAAVGLAIRVPAAIIAFHLVNPHVGLVTQHK